MLLGLTGSVNRGAVGEAVLLMAGVDAVAVVVITDVVVDAVVVVVVVAMATVVISAVVAVVLSSSDDSIECTTIYHYYKILKLPKLPFSLIKEPSFMSQVPVPCA